MLIPWNEWQLACFLHNITFCSVPFCDVFVSNVYVLRKKSNTLCCRSIVIHLHRSTFTAANVTVMLGVVKNLPAHWKLILNNGMLCFVFHWVSIFSSIERLLFRVRIIFSTLSNNGLFDLHIVWKLVRWCNKQIPFFDMQKHHPIECAKSKHLILCYCCCCCCLFQRHQLTTWKGLKFNSDTQSESRSCLLEKWSTRMCLKQFKDPCLLNFHAINAIVKIPTQLSCLWEDFPSLISESINVRWVLMHWKYWFN